MNKYYVSLSQPGEGEWDEPEPIIASLPAHAAEARLKSEALFCDDWLEHEWDAHVRRPDPLGDLDWYFRLEKPRRIVKTSATPYIPK